MKATNTSEKIKIVQQLLIKKIPLFWNRFFKLIFSLFFLVCLSFAIYIWQQSIYNAAGWSDEKKTEFLDSQEKGILFKQSDFEKALKDVSDRQNAYSSNYQPIKNIFLPYK